VETVLAGERGVEQRIIAQLMAVVDGGGGDGLLALDEIPDCIRHGHFPFLPATLRQCGGNCRYNQGGAAERFERF